VAPENILAMADEALYKAKKAGRNQSVMASNYSSDVSPH